MQLPTYYYWHILTVGLAEACKMTEPLARLCPFSNLLNADETDLVGVCGFATFACQSIGCSLKFVAGKVEA